VNVAISVKEGLQAREKRHEQYLLSLERIIDSEIREKWDGTSPVVITLTDLFYEEDVKPFSLKYGRVGWDLELPYSVHGEKMLVLKPKDSVEVK
jgi:hypothetical protein